MVIEQDKGDDGNRLAIRDEFLKENWDLSASQSSLLKYNKKIFMLTEKGRLLKIGPDGNVEDSRMGGGAMGAGGAMGSALMPYPN